MIMKDVQWNPIYRWKDILLQLNLSLGLLGKQAWPRGYKTFFMLNSVEHEILNAHKYKNINKFSFL